MGPGIHPRRPVRLMIESEKVSGCGACALWAPDVFARRAEEGACGGAGAPMVASRLHVRESLSNARDSHRGRKGARPTPGR